MRDVPENPLCELVDDETFVRLYELGLLNESTLTKIKRKIEFLRLREELGSSTAAIAEIARREFREFSTIRQAVYRRIPADDLLHPSKDGKHRKEDKS